MSKILYLGLNPPPGVVHYPVIRTEKIDSEKLQWALLYQKQFTHLIFTSKEAVYYWDQAGGSFDQEMIAIGEATARVLKQHAVSVKIAPFATQEGVMTLLQKEHSYLYLRSKLARPLLANFLQENGFHHETVDLYQTLFQKLEPVPNPLDFDEIVFTSPSTVQGFLKIFGSLPKGPRLTSIGPITEKALH